MKRVAVITGLTGMDGSHLADFLLDKNYRVFGLKRRSSQSGLGCASHLEGNPDVEIVEGDLADLSSIQRLCNSARPDEFYNLASQSHVKTSFEQPIYTLEATGQGVINCLEAIRQSGLHTRFYQASSSEMFGGSAQAGADDEPPFANEESLFHPRSPYACAKLYGYWVVRTYRESYKMFACNGILFNHEGPRRSHAFVTRKITLGVARIVAGLQSSIGLGNLEARRDWGYAPDYVRGMWLMLNHHHPDDFVLATGEQHSIREFCDAAFGYAGLGPYQDYVKVDPRFYRPAEVHTLLGDATKAKTVLGWEPEVTFEELVRRMVDHDVAETKK
jgi:GDPmannose 4,6-dehydratase